MQCFFCYPTGLRPYAVDEEMPLSICWLSVLLLGDSSVLASLGSFGLISGTGGSHESSCFRRGGLDFRFGSSLGVSGFAVVDLYEDDEEKLEV